MLTSRPWLIGSIIIDVLVGLGLAWIWFVDPDPWWRRLWYIGAASSIASSIYYAVARLRGR